MHTAKNPAPITRVQIRHLIVHDIATRLPKCLSRNDFSWLVPLKLEQDPAFAYVPENRSGMAMRRPGVCGWKFDELCHRMCALGIQGGVTHSRSVTLMFSATNMSSTLTPIQPFPWATFAPRTGTSST